MKLKELELVEKVAEKSDLTLFLGEREGLTEQANKTYLNHRPGALGRSL